MQGLWASHHLCILSTFPSLNQRFVFTAVFNLESKVAAPKKKKNRKDAYSIMEYLLTIHHYYDYVLASHGKALHKAKDSNKHLSGHVLPKKHCCVSTTPKVLL